MGMGQGAAIRLRERLSAKTVALAVVFGVIVGLPIAALSLAARAGHPQSVDLRDSAEATAPAPVPTWRTVATRHAGFDVDAPRWRPLGQKMTVLRRSDGLAREHFQFGEAADGRRHAAVVVDRGEIGTGDAAAELTMLFADLEIAARVRASPLPLDTKFGPLPSADVTIDTAEGPKACLAFLLSGSEARLRIAAWTCNGGPEIVSRAEAACLADRIFAVGLRDPAVAAIFSRAELRRQDGCAVVPAAAPTTGFTERGGRPALRTNRL
jgi:hypothetical protein